MGNARGVEIRESGIRLSFAYRGERIRRTILVEGKAIAPTPANIKYAVRLLAEIKLKIRAGNFVMREYFPEGGTVAAGTTVAHQLDHWLSVKVAENSTLAGYLSAVKFWKPFIGEKQVSALKHSDILRAIKTRPDLSGKTVNNYVSALRSAMDLAVLDKLLSENPVAAVPSAKWQREPPDPFDREEVEKIIDYARAKFAPTVANLIAFRFFSGLRTSEMVALRWHSIDWNKKQVLIHEAVVKGLRKQTKTNKARLVSLNSRALDALERQKEQTPRKQLGSMASDVMHQAAPKDSQTVFADPTHGEPWADDKRFRNPFWVPMLKALGIRYRPPNNMRHTYATMLLMAGATPAYAAKQMGHSVEMFLNVYSKWLDDAQGDIEQAKLESFIGQNSPGTPLKKQRSR